MATEPKKMRNGYDYPHRLLFREKMKECSDLKDSTAKNFETAIVNSQGVYFVKAQVLWTKLMPSVPLPTPIALKSSVASVEEPTPPVEAQKRIPRNTLTKTMLKGWVNKVFTEAETLEFLSDLWLQKEIS
jgi:hypothetical protein